MSKNPIYGFCSAGCKYEAVRHDDWEDSISSVTLVADEAGHFADEAIARYHVKATAKAEALKSTTSWGEMYGSQIAVVNCKAYYIALNVSNRETFYCRDLNTGEATVISSGGSILRGMALCAVGKNIYLFGGSDSSNKYSKNILKYDIDSGSMTELSATLTMESRCMACCEYEGRIYIFGGENVTSFDGSEMLVKSAMVQIFDASTSTVTMSDALLPKQISRLSCAKGNDGIYIYGKNGAIWKYSDDTVTEIGQSLYEEVNSVGCAVIGDKHYLFGGCKSDDTNVKTVQVFDTKTKTLEVLPVKLSNALHGAACCSYGDNIYIVGGSLGALSNNNYSRYETTSLYNPASYECSFIYKRKTSSGAEYSINIPLSAYDDLRPYFEIEIYSTKYDANTKTILIAHAVNGVGRKLALSAVGEITDTDTETITIIGATKAYKINLHGGLHSTDVSKKKSVVLVDEVTQKTYELFVSDGKLMMKEREGE